MASEIRVDKINSLSGVGTVTLSPTGVDIAGITTAATLRATTGIVTTLTAVSSAKVGSGVTLSPDGDIFATGVTTSTTFVGALTGNVTGNISGGTVAGSTGTFTGDVDIADKIIHTGDTNTAIRFPSADTVSVETGGSERVRVDSNGRILQGSSTGRNTALMAAQAAYQLEGVGSNASNFSIFCNSNGTAAGGIEFGKTRGTSTGGTTVVASGDDLGHISFEGSDGSAQRVAARINVQVDGTPGSSDMPGRIRFLTTPDGSASEVERLRITSDGKVGINLTAPTRPLHIASDEDLTSFTGTTKGAFCISNSDYTSGEYSAIDFTYTGSDNPVGRIATKITGGGSSLHFGTSNNYSSGITNEALMITSGGDIGLATLTPNLTGYTSPVTSIGKSGNAYSVLELQGTQTSDGAMGLITGYNTSGSARIATIAWNRQAANNSGAISFETASAGSLGERVRITNDGLTFGGDTATANALDDYEEGTWTPGIDKNASSMSGVSYGWASGTYTKIGRLVMIWFDFKVNSVSNSGSGVPYVTNLPFSATTGNTDNGGYGAPTFRNATLMDTDFRIYGSSSHLSSTVIYLYKYNSSGVESTVSLQSSGRLTGQAFYFTTA